jgi:hypothetical protein
MKRIALDVGVLFALASIVVLYVALSQPGLRDVALHVYVLVVGALAMLGVVTATSDALPRRTRGDFERALAEGSSRDRTLPEIDRVAREVTLATSSSYDLHYRLLPHLRAIASARLERRGKRVGPAELGRWWTLLDPERDPPADRFAPGITRDDLRALVDDLERI